jgi:hypothetical protein
MGEETLGDKEATGYRSRWKRWLAVYLVVGALVYVAIYFAFFNHSGGGY